MNTKDQHSGEIVKAARQAKRLTQEALASKTGYNQSYISLWEQGKRRPSADMAWAICQILPVDFEILRSKLADEKFVQDEAKRQTKHRIQSSTTIQYTPVVRERPKMRADFDQYTEVTGVVRIPVLAEIPAGDPVYISEELLKQVEDFEYLVEDMISDLRNVFALTISGHSMSHRKVDEGDRIIVDAGQLPGDGDLAVVRVSENQGILREVHYEGDIAVLETGYGPPQVVSREELVFVGKVIRICKTP